MTLTDYNQVIELVDKTEQNLIRAGKYREEFATPILNEWRCGTRHIITAVLNPKASSLELQAALEHWRRAYFDSCDVILTFQLIKLSEIHSTYKNYPELVATILPNFWTHVQTMRKVQKTHELAAQKSAEEKVAEYDSLVAPMTELDKIIDELDNSEADMAFAIARQKEKEAKMERSELKNDIQQSRTFIVSVVGVIVGVVSAIIAVVLTLLVKN